MNNQEKIAMKLQKDILAVMEKHGCRDFLFVAGFRNVERTYIHGIVGSPGILVDMTQHMVEHSEEATYIFKNITIPS